MSSSRIRVNSEHIFECFFEVGCARHDTKSGRSTPFILQKIPNNYNQEEVLKSVPQFAFPCQYHVERISHFSFVLTNIDSKWTFGFCRHEPSSETCLVMLSSLPWHTTFYKILNKCSELMNMKANYLEHFLDYLYKSEMPQPGMTLTLTWCVENKIHEFSASCPDHLKIPSIPEDRNLTEYFNAVDITSMIKIFANMLNERRIIITSKNLCRLSACVQAANSLIYPMHWQHIFIPVLPTHLLDYLSAPMPFLIGVPAVTMNRVKLHELGDIVILNADDNTISSPFDDVESLPDDIVHMLKKNLRNPGTLLGDGVARSFLRALVILIGGYREALKLIPGEKITFNHEAFINTRHTSMQPFLAKMLQLQIFRQFIEGRLEMLNKGEGFSDEFEFEVNMYQDKGTVRLKTQYKEWANTMKKEGGAMFKIVKDKSKRAYKDLKSKMKEQNQHDNHHNSQYYSSSRSVKLPPSSSGFGFESTGVKPISNGSNSEPSSPISKRSIMKNVSGIKGISKTDKTVTYVRDKERKDGFGHERMSKKDKNHNHEHANSNQTNPINFNNQLYNGLNNSASFSSSVGANHVSSSLKPNREINLFAPEASPENSDVNSDVSFSDENHEMVLKEIDLMSELKTMLSENSSSFLSFEDLSTTTNNSISNLSKSNNNILNMNSTPLPGPIPPPRTNFSSSKITPGNLISKNSSLSSMSSSSSEKSQIGSAKGKEQQQAPLIELDSPPSSDEKKKMRANNDEIIFDPLLEKSVDEKVEALVMKDNRSKKTQSVYSTSRQRPTPSHNNLFASGIKKSISNDGMNRSGSSWIPDDLNLTPTTPPVTLNPLATNSILAQSQSCSSASPFDDNFSSTLSYKPNTSTPFNSSSNSIINAIPFAQQQYSQPQTKNASLNNLLQLNCDSNSTSFNSIQSNPFLQTDKYNRTQNVSVNVNSLTTSKPSALKLSVTKPNNSKCDLNDKSSNIIDIDIDSMSDNRVNKLSNSSQLAGLSLNDNKLNHNNSNHQANKLLDASSSKTSFKTSNWQQFE